MPHDTPLITTIVAGLGLAFVFGFLAQRLRLPTIAGYLVAGVVIGPFTPGYVADQRLAGELAELGVILLMFGVGLHFSLKDLLAVRAIAVPGAIGQIAAATLLGMGLAWLLGWSVGAGFVFGLALSVASTVVLLRALQERRIVETERGRIAVGWLIVEDIAMVLTLVLLPPLAGMLGGTVPAESTGGLAASFGFTSIWATLGLTAVKIAAFVTLMLVFGRKLIPWLLHAVAHSGSRELFRLSVLALALGVAYGSSALFGVSFALGAFFAGMVMAESPLSTQAARETLPLRDAFAVLFFVSVGMLFDPAALLQAPIGVIATFLVIVLGKSVVAYLIVIGFRYPRATALTIAVSLAQIGEFSFILIVLGRQLGIVPEGAQDLVVAGALVSILVNPLLFLALDRWQHRGEAKAEAAEAAEKADSEAAATKPDDEAAAAPTALAGHAVLVGHGRVGRRVAEALKAGGQAFLVIEAEADAAAPLAAAGIETHVGTAGEPGMLERINLAGARWVISAIPDAFEAGALIERARSANPNVRIVARAAGPEAVDYLKGLGADVILVGEEEIAAGMIRATIGGAAPTPPRAAAAGSSASATASGGMADPGGLEH
ncbi:YbaL family putative K(+) efflux transporter [Prosthecomicrobium hirschii]|uniref:Sodium:proton antiporter n=1 Tax=Prosthecodimorpha hirschii TaxID=665126 RepID=A0A0P6WKR5_9HYPH|nr:YbaL family putative K(+) efflux transporter [Prosthecomicrobium hirschii]KPL55339.1 sodium:proton antiporter [Prosthecomicrobium hirschii]MCW1839696.1 Kef family K(+) transporter [Prosthecomicrobium hirschii]